MLRYVMMRILGAGDGSKGLRSPGDIAPPLGGWEGLNQHGGLTHDGNKREAKGTARDRSAERVDVMGLPAVTAFPSCPACRASVRGQDAGLEQTGVAGGQICASGRASLWAAQRPQSSRRVAIRAEVPLAAKAPRDWSQAGVTKRERGLDRVSYG